MIKLLGGFCVALALVLGAGHAAGADVFDLVDHHEADSGGVKIHYVTRGRSPLIVMIHGFPDFWYGWREHRRDPGLAARHGAPVVETD